MRTNIVLSETLTNEAMRLTGATTKREVVDLALRELVRMRTTKAKLKAAKGTMLWEGDLRKARAARV
jgi:Arc/MetJ family transcription regulator